MSLFAWANSTSAHGSRSSTGGELHLYKFTAGSSTAEEEEGGGEGDGGVMHLYLIQHGEKVIIGHKRIRKIR